MVKYLFVIFVIFTSCKQHNLCYYSNTIYVDSFETSQPKNNKTYLIGLNVMKYTNNKYVYISTITINQPIYVYQKYSYYILKDNKLIEFKNNC